jgi:DNA-binding NtrC family response regulator
MKSVLIVDDDPGMRLILRRFLEREKFQVEEATNGAEAMKTLLYRNFDLVITDMIMPEKSGFELIDELLAMRPASKIIAFSGGGVVGATPCLELARRAGAVKTFAKPFDMKSFVAAVKEILK